MLPLSLRSGRALAYVLSFILFMLAIGLEVHRRQTSTRERARFGILRDDAELFTDALATSLRLPEVCTEMIGPGHLATNSAQAIALAFAYDPSAEQPLRAGKLLWPGTELGRLDLTLPEDPDMRTRFNGRELRRYRGRLDLELATKDRFPKGIKRALELYAWLDESGNVQSCFGSLSVAGLCNMTGAYYDVHAETPADRCPPSLGTTIETKTSRLHRGRCRTSGVVFDAKACALGAGNAALFQDRVGGRIKKQLVCQICDH